MSAYRTPEEDRAAAEQDARINAALDEAVEHGANLVAAMRLGEPQDVIELWTDRVWNGLRSGLRDDPHSRVGEHLAHDGEDRLAAIVLLLTERMNAAADRVLAGIEVDR